MSIVTLELCGALRQATTRIKLTLGKKVCGFFAFRGLSAAPLGATTLGVTSNFLNLWLGE